MKTNPWYHIPTVLMISLWTTSLVWGYSGGSGTAEDPYQIADGNDLLELSNGKYTRVTETSKYGPQDRILDFGDLDKHFILTADIDLNPNLSESYLFDKAVIAPDHSPEDGKFEESFLGILDGQGHAIKNLTILNDSSAHGLGLVGSSGYSSNVMNLRIENIYIASPGGRAFGGLIGKNYGKINNCFVSGSIVEPSQQSGGPSRVGGLVGENYGTIRYCRVVGHVNGYETIGGLVGENHGWIYNSAVMGSVSGKLAFVGGLIGESNTNIVKECYSTASVDGYSVVGGFAGIHRGGSVLNCYARGSVYSMQWKAGFMALNPYDDGSFAYFGELGRCYATGSTVKGSSNMEGGFIANCFEERQIWSCFWDSQSTGQRTSWAGTGLPTVAMQNIQTYLDANWDFEDETQNGQYDTWFMPANDYPRLTWEKEFGISAVAVTSMTSQNDGPITAVNDIMEENFLAGVTSIVMGPNQPTLAAEGVDDWDLGTTAPLRGQAAVHTEFANAVQQVVLLVSGLDQSGTIRVMDEQGREVDYAIPFAPKDFTTLANTSSGKPVLGLALKSGFVPIYAMEIAGLEGETLSLELISIVGVAR